MSLVAHKYTPAQMSERELDSTFAARGHTVDHLLRSIRDQNESGTLGSFIITGARGAGKSTIIRMLDLRLRQDPELNRAWIPVLLPEEQFGVATLWDFLTAILRELAGGGWAEAQAWLEKAEREANDEQSFQIAVTGLKEITNKTSKRLLVFVENLNLMFDECLDDHMKATLRRLLMTEPFMMLVGSSVHLIDSLKKYDEAFFNYFGRVHLDRLDDDQVFELLQRRAEFDGNDRFLNQFRRQRSKIRAIVHLSGGNPRLILMLYELLSQHGIASIVQCLRRLVDELTPLLKDEIENLSPQQRKVIHALMEKGGTAQPAELAERTRLPLNAVTSNLKRLKDAQFIEVLGGGKGRAAYYTVPDKLFAIWYQMRYLHQNRRRIELFVEVLRVWFDAEERFLALKTLTNPHDSQKTLVLHDSAMTAEYFAASLLETPYETDAKDHAIRQWLKVGDNREAAFAHAEFMGLSNDAEKNYATMAYANLSQWCLEHEEIKTAMDVLNEIINDVSCSKNDRLNAIFGRGCAYGVSGDLRRACEDFKSVLEVAEAPKDLVARALGGRGLAKGILGDKEGEIADYTAVIEMEGISKVLVAMALFNRGIAKGELGDKEGQIIDYTVVVELEGVPKEQAAKALFSRGGAKGELGDKEGEIADYTAVMELEGAPKEQTAMALFARGVVKGDSGNIKGAIADYTALVEMEGTSKEQAALALFNRGASKGEMGDNEGEIADYTAVVELEGALKEPAARALLYRGIAKGELGNKEGQLADYTALVELEGAPKEHLAAAYLNRGALFFERQQKAKAIADWNSALDLNPVIEQSFLSAIENLFCLHWREKKFPEADSILTRLEKNLHDNAEDQKALKIIEFLSDLASTRLTSGWIYSARRLFNAIPKEDRQSLAFIQPVCSVLETGDKSHLNPLAPEHRDLALKVLSRFEEGRSDSCETPDKRGSA